jgi:hypothetical protein
MWLDRVLGRRVVRRMVVMLGFTSRCVRPRRATSARLSALHALLEMVRTWLWRSQRGRGATGHAAVGHDCGGANGPCGG